jgi:predicted RNase H-like HicB family nuclease
MIIQLDINTNGTWLVTSVDMPDFTAAGDSLPDALAAAADAAEKWLSDQNLNNE